mmetsp:Transcript_6008/g.9785  ORF Transcript_6008/g.9785 Transcript_6008/m.9785 type:complete len:88 (-) Transcript_6008:384-647(-)
MHYGGVPVPLHMCIPSLDPPPLYYADFLARFLFPSAKVGEASVKCNCSLVINKIYKCIANVTSAFQVDREVNEVVQGVESMLIHEVP